MSARRDCTGMKASRALRRNHSSRGSAMAQIAWAGIALVLASASLNAQEFNGSRSGVILTLPTSPRSLGLADASAAVSGDAWALFTSPAQLARAGTLQVALASEAYLASTQLSAIALALPAFGGTLGVGATLLDYGTIREIASSVPGAEGVETGRTWAAQDNAVVVGYARALGSTRAVRVGATVSALHSQIADLSASGVAGSFGAAWSGGSGWHVGGALQHIGPAITLGATSGELPLLARIAVGAPTRTVRGFDVRPMAELRFVRGGGEAVAVAAEATWRSEGGRSLAFRGGYTLRSDDGDDRSPVSFGIGTGIGSIELDYAIERFETIDQVTHRLGVRYARRATR